MKKIRLDERITWEKETDTPPQHPHTEKHDPDTEKQGEHFSYQTKHTGHNVHRDSHTYFEYKSKSRRRVPMQPGNKQLKNAAWYHRRMLPAHHDRPPDAGKK